MNNLETKLPQIPPEVNSRMTKSNRAVYTKYEVQKEERQDILKNLGDAALLLYQYYLRMESMQNIPMEDDEAAHYLLWSKRKTARIRKQLIKAKYFKKIVFISSKGKKTVTYYIGQEEVNKS